MGVRKGEEIKGGGINLASLGADIWAKLLPNPYVLDVARQRGQNRNGSSTLAILGARSRAQMQRNLYFLRGRQKKRRNNKWLHHPCLLGCREGGGTATQPLRSLGFHTKGDKIRRCYISPAFWGAQRWAECYINPAISGVPRMGDRITSSCITPRRPKLGGIATQPSSFHRLAGKGATTQVVLAPLPSSEPGLGHKCNVTTILSGFAKTREKIRSGYITTAFLGAEKGQERLRNTTSLRGFAQKEIKLEVATSALPNGGPKSGRNSCITPAI